MIFCCSKNILIRELGSQINLINNGFVPDINNEEARELERPKKQRMKKYLKV